VHGAAAIGHENRDEPWIDLVVPVEQPLRSVAVKVGPLTAAVSASTACR